MIRRERSSDILGIKSVVTKAFGRPNEAILVDALREAEALSLSLVAEVNARPVGHVGFSAIRIGEGHHGLALAPLAVAPNFQRMGIGTDLVLHGLEQCRKRQCPIVLVLGEPSYYKRFGFKPASQYRIICPFAVPDEAYMALELFTNAATGISGTVRYRPEFSSV